MEKTKAIEYESFDMRVNEELFTELSVKYAAKADEADMEYLRGYYQGRSEAYGYAAELLSQARKG